MSIHNIIAQDDDPLDLHNAVLSNDTKLVQSILNSSTLSMNIKINIIIILILHF